MNRWPDDARCLRDDLQKLALTWLVRLGLPWRVTVVAGRDDQMDHEGSVMEIERHETAQRAVIYVRGWVIDGGDMGDAATAEVTDPATYLEEALVHELCHLLYWEHHRLVADQVAEEIGGRSWMHLESSWQLSEERQVDALSRAVVASYADRPRARMRNSVQPASDQPCPTGIEWLAQELDESVHVLPLHEEGHLLGAPPVGSGVDLDDPWCWCRPTVTVEDDGEVYAKQLVTHRDARERAADAC